VPYFTRGEFDVQLEDLIMQVGRLCDERSRDAALANARRTLTLAHERFKRGEKMPAKDRVALANAIEKVRTVAHGDERCQDQLADIEDYVESNLLEP
jgi:hypothetical protein